MYYSALAERRVFLESWYGTPETLGLSPSALDEGQNLFIGRLRLNDAVFSRADSEAVRILARNFGVRYLLLDKVHGSGSDKLDTVGEKVFSNASIDIYLLT
jgi:hypothetical protein